ERENADAMREKEVTPGKANDTVAIELLSIKGKDEHDEQEGQQARHHLPFRVPPVGAALLALDHAPLSSDMPWLRAARLVSRSRSSSPLQRALGSDSEVRARSLLRTGGGLRNRHARPPSCHERCPLIVVGVRRRRLH